MQLTATYASDPDYIALTAELIAGISSGNWPLISTTGCAHGITNHALANGFALSITWDFTNPNEIANVRVTRGVPVTSIYEQLATIAAGSMDCEASQFRSLPHQAIGSTDAIWFEFPMTFIPVT
jgi:hypothetical protein